MYEALSQPRLEVTTGEAAALARELFALEASSVVALPGERDINFRLADANGRKFVLKVLHPAEDPAVAEFQALALVHIADSDPSLPVPRVVEPVRGVSRVLAQTPGDPGYRVRCVTYLPGRPLAGDASSPSLWRSLGAFVGRLDAALAEFTHPADDHELLWDLKRADRALALVEAVPDGPRRTLIRGVLERFREDMKRGIAELPMQVIHNDFNSHNLLISSTDPEQVTGVIDFGDAVRASRSQELATAAAYQDGGARHALEPAAHIAAAYHVVNPLSREELAVVPDLIAVRLALSVVITSWRAALHPEEADYILRSQATVVSNLERLAALPDAGSFFDLVARLAES